MNVRQNDKELAVLSSGKESSQRAKSNILDKNVQECALVMALKNNRKYGDRQSRHERLVTQL